MSNDFWRGKSSSFGRGQSEAWYRQKALEHVSFIESDHQRLSVADLACGAGELLYYLKDRLPIKRAIDFSQSMLEVAKGRLGGSLILECGNVVEAVATLKEEVILSCCGVGQYLSPEEMDIFIQRFVENPYAKALYLFDMVEPSFYLLWMGRFVHYDIPMEFRKQKRLWALDILRDKVENDPQWLEQASLEELNEGMGYGYSCNFWFQKSQEHNLKIEMVSSKSYEYRYHLKLVKQ